MGGVYLKAFSQLYVMIDEKEIEREKRKRFSLAAPYSPYLMLPAEEYNTSDMDKGFAVHA
jgi:hypothetical protein